MTDLESLFVKKSYEELEDILNGEENDEDDELDIEEDDTEYSDDDLGVDNDGIEAINQVQVVENKDENISIDSKKTISSKIPLIIAGIFTIGALGVLKVLKKV